MKFKIYCRYDAEREVSVKEPHIWISIYTPGDDPAKINHNEFCKEVLSLCFNDTEKDDTYGMMPITQEQADQIVSFVNRHKGDIDLINIHCDMGFSRSPAVAAALSIWINGDDGIFHQPNYMPNSLVKSLILRKIRLIANSSDT